MKILSFFNKLFWASIFTTVSWHCAKEQPIEADLSHLSVGDTTLIIADSSVHPYWIAPTIGHSDYLYFGKKNGIAASFTLVEFPEHDAWAYYHETSIYVIDSIRFILYSSDSLLQESSTPILYFKADSQFNESSSDLEYPPLSRALILPPTTVYRLLCDGTALHLRRPVDHRSGRAAGRRTGWRRRADRGCARWQRTSKRRKRDRRAW